MRAGKQRPGLLVAFCGIDGSGKSSQIRLLEEFLQARAVPSVTFKQPTPFYRDNAHVRNKLDNSVDSSRVEFLALLSAADRLLQQGEVIEPALAAGNVVLMDRYVYSALAYMHARGIQDSAWLESINRYARTPDLTFYIDVSPELALRRVIARDGKSTKKEEQHIEVMSVVRSRFLELVDSHGLVRIDGSMPIDEIHHGIAGKVASLL